MQHAPVLLEETLTALNLSPGKFIIDGTVNGGGHGRAIINKIQPNGIFLGVDWDERAIERLRISNHGLRSLILVNDNYAHMPNILKNQRLPLADGFLLDLGFSSDQMAEEGRGFSFMRDEPLDMRYHRASRTVNDEPWDDGKLKTAAEIVNHAGEKELADILWRYSEEKAARKIAKEIVHTRTQKPIKTTRELCAIVQRVKPRRNRIHSATQTFMALRIAVNRELENIERVLQALPQFICSGGTAAIISFHSLEDRIVKTRFRIMERQCLGRRLMKKAIKPMYAEIKKNPKSRSARLRAFQLA